jgi:dienelactone hydrolase
MRPATRIATLLVSLAASTALAGGKDVDLQAADGTRLRATYYAAAKPGPGIVLLHMCNSDRRAWASLGPRLAAAGLHALALDYRGFGESGGPRFADIPDAERAALVAKWGDDVDRALAHLVAQPGVDRARIGVAGGSCGVNQSLQLARRHPDKVKTAVLLAGGTNRDGEEHLARAAWMPVLAVGSRDDGGIVDVMTWLLGFSSNPANQLKVYEKGGHGTELFAVHADLEPAIVSWFTRHLLTSPVKPAEQAGPPGPSAARSAELRSPGGGARLLAQLRAARKAGRPFPLPPEGAVNAVGYELMQAGRAKDAIGVLELNVELHPDSANVYDSLADAHVAANDRPRAVEYAKKAIDALARDKDTPEEFKQRIRASAEAKLQPPQKP